jgi:hypothetical protein
MSEKRAKKGFVFWVTLAMCGGGVLAFLLAAARHTAQEAVIVGETLSRGAASEVGTPGVEGGEMGQGTEAQEVVLDALPQITQKQISVHGTTLRPMDGLTDAQYAAKKAAARAGGIPGKPGNAAPAVGAIKSQSVGSSRGFLAQQEVSATPPDMALAVGENFVVQLVNSSIAVYDKNGNLQSGFPKSADAFFNLASGTNTTCPRGFYDWANHRFVFVMLTQSSPTTGTNTGSIMLAASKTYDPRGGWWVYQQLITFPAGDCPDFPTLGHDSNNWGTNATMGGIYIGVNDFGGTGNCAGANFTQAHVYMFPKDAIYAGAGYGFYHFSGFKNSGTYVDTLQPANMTDRSDHPDTIFLVNSYNLLFSDPSNGLAIWSISGPTTGSVNNPNNPFAFLQGGNAPVVSSVVVSTVHNYTFPPNADEPNASGSGVCSGCIDTGDKRISGQVKYHAGELFGALETGVSGTPSTAGPIWFVVHPVENGTNSVITGVEERHEDCYNCGGWVNNGSAFYATLQPDQENNLVMVFEYSTDKQYPSLVFASRRVTFHDNWMNGAGNFLVSGSAYYSQARWGNYTATAPDLTIANFPTMWFAGMYANSSGNWGTAIGEARYHFPSDQ